MHFMVIFLELFTVWAFITGVIKFLYYYDFRFPFPVQLMYFGNTVFPAVTLGWSFLWLLKKKEWNVQKLLYGLLACSVLNTFAAVSVPVLANRYYLPLGSGMLRQYLLFALIDLLFFIGALIYLASSFIVIWKERSPEYRYKEENLFFLGQIISKLNTTSKTMTLISITLVLAIFLFIAAPILKGWALGYLNVRSMYDVQVFSAYNDVYDEKDLPQDNYEIVTDFLDEHNIETAYDSTFSLYLPKKEDFSSRMKYDFPVVAISLSDYNAIRKMLGYEPISLGENEFATQWQTIATEEERDRFLSEHTDVLYVFPDHICKKLLPVMRNRYITTTEKISYENACELEMLFTMEYPEQTESGASYGVRFCTLQTNRAIANNFILQTGMIYGAVVLMVICLTVLSLQQLLDAGQYKYRFSVLRKLGVEETKISKLILKQLGVWFGLPIIVAIIVAAVVDWLFCPDDISRNLSIYRVH